MQTRYFVVSSSWHIAKGFAEKHMKEWYTVFIFLTSWVYNMCTQKQKVSKNP